VPELDFLILVHRDGASWVARSILTSHVARGKDGKEALANLTGAIDFAIELAAREGYTAQEWYEDQEPSDEKYLVMFKSAIRTVQTERAKSGRYVRRETIATQAA